MTEPCKDEILLINFRKCEIPQITPNMIDSSFKSFKSIKTQLHNNKEWCLILVSTFLLNIFLIFCNWNSLTFSRRICHNSGIVRGSWHGCAAPSKFPPLFFFYRRHPFLLSLGHTVIAKWLKYLRKSSTVRRWSVVRIGLKIISLTQPPLKGSKGRVFVLRKWRECFVLNKTMI